MDSAVTLLFNDSEDAHGEEDASGDIAGKDDPLLRKAVATPASESMSGVRRQTKRTLVTGTVQVRVPMDRAEHSMGSRFLAKDILMWEMTIECRRSRKRHWKRA
jgi:hypothetical protein